MEYCEIIDVDIIFLRVLFLCGSKIVSLLIWYTYRPSV